MSSDDFQPVPGMSDIATPDIFLWQHVEHAARQVLERYAFHEVRTPILERTSVFTRSLGDATDVVQKEMYSFTDRGNRDLTLRPEGTAGVIRHLAGRLQQGEETRVYYIGPMFRSERPQAGRRRQFHQLGVEALGAPCPAVDAEIIALQADLLQAWGLSDFVVQINTRGTAEDHEQVARKLRERLASEQVALCEDCQRRYAANPLRILDCKRAGCRAIVDTLPPLTESLSQASQAYLDEVVALLKRLDIRVERNPGLVRGLDYYEHTVWEVTHTGLGAQDALAGGGRYALTLGKRRMEGVGFAMGLERVLAVLKSKGVDASGWAPRLAVWLVSPGSVAFEENIRLMQSLRSRGISCGMDMRGRNMKAQMKMANRAGSRYVILRGETELEEGTFLLKNMEDGAQKAMDMPELIVTLRAATAGPMNEEQ